jgi:hypothetical protein
MKAHVGDMIEVRGFRVDDRVRRGEVLEVRGKDGAPPYLVQWDDDPHQCLYFPGTDAVVRHLEHGAGATPVPAGPRDRDVRT